MRDTAATCTLTELILYGWVLSALEAPLPEAYFNSSCCRTSEKSLCYSGGVLSLLLRMGLSLAYAIIVEIKKTFLPEW